MNLIQRSRMCSHVINLAGLAQHKVIRPVAPRLMPKQRVSVTAEAATRGWACKRLMHSWSANGGGCVSSSNVDPMGTTGIVGAVDDIVHAGLDHRKQTYKMNDSFVFQII
jgi:hypothetical protein